MQRNVLRIIPCPVHLPMLARTCLTRSASVSYSTVHRNSSSHPILLSLSGGAQFCFIRLCQGPYPMLVAVMELAAVAAELQMQVGRRKRHAYFFFSRVGVEVNIDCKVNVDCKSSSSNPARNHSIPRLTAMGNGKFGVQALNVWIVCN